MLIIALLLAELGKLKLLSYSKTLIWLKKVEHYKNINTKSNFGNCKFTSISNLNEKSWKLKIKKKNLFFKVYKKMGKEIIKLGDNEI